MKYYLLTTLLFLSLSLNTILAQEAEKPTENTETTETKKAEETSDSTKNKSQNPGNRRPEKNRLRFSFGLGGSSVTPGVLNEAPNAWMINSIIHSQSNPDYQQVFPYAEAGPSSALSGRFGFDYSFNDRLNINAQRFSINQKLSRASPADVNYIHAPNGSFRPAIFEGIRVTKYVEDRRNVDISYLHPLFLRGLKIGIFVGKEWYQEFNEISLGSYSRTRLGATSTPDSTTWNSASVVSGNYRLDGTIAGPALRYQLFDYLGFTYRLSQVNRKGSMDLSGAQLITTDTGTDTLGFVAAYADVSDKGIRHEFETVITFYCRYGLHIGFLSEDLTRSYGLYLAHTVGDGFYSKKTPDPIGYGEMASSHKLKKTDIYVKFSAAIFL